MPAIYIVSDTHFGHAGVCRFTQADGVTKLRPWTDPNEMDEALVKAWNETVKPEDKVYHLGDVVMNRRSIGIMHRLNGKKVLIKGNHDNLRMDEYAPFFEDVHGCYSLSNMLLSHIPIHEASFRKFDANVHGHLHSERVMKTDKHGVSRIDTRYHCVSVELTDFKPILLEHLVKRIKEERENV